MDLLSVIQRWHYRDRLSIREIERRTHLSRNTIRKYLRSGELEPVFARGVRMSKLDGSVAKLIALLETAFGFGLERLS